MKTLDRLKRIFTVKTADQAGRNMLNLLFWILTALPFLGLVAQLIAFTVFLDLTNAIPFWKEPPYLITVGYGLLISGAAYLGGGFAGFLFGLPRMLSNPDQSNKDYSRNDNLIQISDWVTKIIVGLGLTNLYKIPEVIGRFGTHYGTFFPIESGDHQYVNGPLIAECIMIYYVIAGFLIGYLWTNIHYIPVLTIMDGITDGLKKKQEMANEMNQMLLDESENVIGASDVDSFERAKATQTRFEGNVLSFEQFNHLVSEAERRMAEGIAIQSDIPVEQSDPNKGRFGGQQTKDGRRITARVTPIGGNELFRVSLTVAGTNEEGRLQPGEAVVFALHPTFPKPIRVVHAAGGRASLEFIAYGAFTVGVVCNVGETLLELNLASLPNAPKEFLQR